MKTFNYESNCVKYRDCFFDVGKYENDKISLSIYGYVEDDKEVSHISNATVDVKEKLEENQVVIDTYTNNIKINNINPEENEFKSEESYINKKDFEKLREEIIKQLQSLADYVEERIEIENAA